MVEITLLDWTRMGGTYCLAGAVPDKGPGTSGYRIVRPMLAKNQNPGKRTFGWWFRLLEGHRRWEIFELVRPAPATPEPPHVEDLWVGSLRPRGCLAPVEQRRAILEATLARPGQPLFGQPLHATRAGAYLQARSGQRSLVTVKVPAKDMVFGASWREGMLDPDFRVQLPLHEIGPRSLPVKDHHLLLRARPAAPDVNRQVAALQTAVQAMGDTVAVRLGLSRPFQYDDARGPGVCWLMADGFFSWSDPQP